MAQRLRTRFAMRIPLGLLEQREYLFCPASDQTERLQIPYQVSCQWADLVHSHTPGVTSASVSTAVSTVTFGKRCRDESHGHGDSVPVKPHSYEMPPP